MARGFWSRWFKKKAVLPQPAVGEATRPRLLMLTSEKRDQPLYRDLEIARRFDTIRVSDSFPFAEFDHDLRRILAYLYPERPPDWVWLNYTHRYTPRLKGWEALEAPVGAWVGDPQDFILEGPIFQEKREFLRRVHPQVLVNPQMHANAWVRQGLEDDITPILECFWGITPQVFYPQNRRRPYDIACLGSHTPGTYPFRNQVRNYLLSQRRLKFFKKMRVGGKDGVVFARAVNRLRACFTDASIYGYTLAKYFEIPACGTLLLAQPTVDLERLGYRDGENFVAVTPEDFVDKMECYLIEAPAAEVARISRAGMELVHERHTWKHRITPLLREMAGPLGRQWPEEVYI